ncbi:MAG: tetratricopeptide repeat protein [Thiotrichaceae bacterium]|nr:tetratricopeptide repeat protein [Thiotrichaceae bacterium]
MDAITAILTAVVAGATEAFGSTAKQAIQDLYAALKQHLQEKHPQAKGSLEALEKKPDSAAKKESLKEDLQDSGVISVRNISITTIIYAVIVLLYQPAQAFNDTKQEVVPNSIGVINSSSGSGTVHLRIPAEEYLRVAKVLGITSDKLGVTQKILDGLLQAVEKRQVPLDKLDSTLTEIAKRYQELLERASKFTSDDSEIKSILEAAKLALEQTQFDKAEQLYNQVSDREVTAIKAIRQEEQPLQEVREKRMFTVAEAKFANFQLNEMQLAHAEAAKYGLQAIEALPAKYEESLGNYLNDTALATYMAGQYNEAKTLFERSVAIREKALGKEHPNVAQSLNSLALLYQVQGNYSQAKPLLERSLAIREKFLGKEHPDVATSVYNLAELYRVQGNYSQANPLFERSLAIREKVLGKEHPKVAFSLNNLAGLYKAQGNYSQAKSLFERSLAIREKVLGEHPDTVLSLNNLAGLYQAQGNYSEAKPLFERSLAIQEKFLGKEHPDVATSLSSLAGVYQAQDDYSKAKSLHERSLVILEKALGKEHPLVARSLNNLAGLYQAQGYYSEAKSLFERSLAIMEKALGKEHPNVAVSLNLLALLYQAQGNYNEAKPLFERSLAIAEKVLGKKHSYTITIQKHLNTNTAGLENRLKVRVMEMIADSPIKKIGVQPGDVLINYDEKPIINTENFRIIRNQEPTIGKLKSLEVQREGKTIKFIVAPKEEGMKLQDYIIEK